jgi:hypothetical protein
MVFKALLIVVVIAILMEDSASIRKTAEEEKEDEEVARAVNKTLAEEEEKRRKEDEDEAKKKAAKKEGNSEKKAAEGSGGGAEERDEALPSNITCPDPVECAPCGPCPEEKPCLPCKECPKEKVCLPCRPCGPYPPCPVVNNTGHNQDCPAPSPCQDSAGMSVPVALLLGACTRVLVTGVAAIIGVVIRYLSPLESGFIFLATVILVWYFCSHYPETARELGARAATLLREAATTLGHRLVEALQRHTEQVGIPVLSLISSYFLI